MTSVRDPASFLPMMVPKSDLVMLVEEEGKEGEVEEEGELTITCILCQSKLAFTRFCYIFSF